QVVLRCGAEGETSRQTRALDNQGVIAGGLERGIDAAKDALATVPDRRELAVNRRRCTHHLAAERVSDRLMTEADAEDRNAGGCFADQVEADAGLFGRAGPGGEDNRLR